MIYNTWNYYLTNYDFLMQRHINFIIEKYYHSWPQSIHFGTFLSYLNQLEKPTKNLLSTEIRYLLVSSSPMFFRIVRYFRSNSSNISWGCLFAARNFPLPLQAIRFNSVRVDSIRRVVWLNSFRDKSGEKRTRNEHGRQTLEITGVRQATGSGSLAFFSIDRLTQRSASWNNDSASMSNRDLSECYPSESVLSVDPYNWVYARSKVNFKIKKIIHFWIYLKSSDNSLCFSARYLKYFQP